jgi:hyperosmotically inducible protein
MQDQEMKNDQILACVLTASLVSPVWSFAAEPDLDRATAVQFVEDSAITAAIKTRLAEGQWSTLTQLDVGTDRAGTVWLSGTAKTQEAAERAVEMARDIDGVVQVRSHIVVNRDSK